MIFKRRQLSIDGINLVLMLLSLLLAIMFPFKTFLYSFAILGPLHYLTEINWLDEKKYFTSQSNHFKKIAVAATIIFILPFVLKKEFFQIIANTTLLSMIGLSIGLSIWRKIFPSLLLMLVFGSIFLVFQNHSFLTSWVAVFIPTIVHVYVFTGIFMLYGALKSKSKLGFASVLILVLIPFVINFIDVDPLHYNFSNSIKTTFINNNFHVLNAKLSGLIGQTEGTGFFFYEVLDLKIQIFIAFAYSYHYLNWFSKTTTIGWHKNFNVKKGLLIGSLWVIVVLLYYIDFSLGFMVVLFFSTLHVFVEFPLNVVTLREVFKELFRLK
ncbi:MAG: hypothetical protein ACI8Q1_000210 [Parvicella sp.]|jgi:hypothetical protein